MGGGVKNVVKEEEEEEGEGGERERGRQEQEGRQREGGKEEKDEGSIGGPATSSLSKARGRDHTQIPEGLTVVGEETARPANTSANPNQFELSRKGNPHTEALARQPRWGWPDRGCDLIQPLRFSLPKNFQPVFPCVLECFF